MTTLSDNPTLYMWALNDLKDPEVVSTTSLPAV